MHYCAPKQSLPLLKDQIVPDHHLTLDKSKHTKPFHAPSKISLVCESFLKDRQNCEDLTLYTAFKFQGYLLGSQCNWISGNVRSYVSCIVFLSIEL